MSDLKLLAERLQNFQDWRKGMHNDMPTVESITYDIDMAIKLILEMASK